MNVLLLAHTLVLTLDLVVTALLWVNYRASRQPYLGLATIAGATEIARQVVDTLLILAVDAPLLYHLTSILQFFSTLFFLAALLRLRDAQTRLMPRTAPLALAFVGIYVVQQLLRVTDTALEWYAFFSPLILTYGLILWRAWFVTRLWPLTRFSLLVTSLALVILRSWIPAHLSPVPDELSFMLYYLEALVFPLTAVVATHPIQSPRDESGARHPPELDTGSSVSGAGRVVLHALLPGGVGVPPDGTLPP